jgi:DNA repair protein RadD
VTKAYDTSGLVTNSMGKYTKDSIDRAYIGKGRLTSSIVADVVERSQGRTGVMFFCATIQHAEEVLASLPPMVSAMVTGKTPKPDRSSILQRFKAGQLKYLANVDVLTTGFDAPNVDTIALLRHTESVGLLQQIIGRGLRLLEGKTECLVLDYAENIKDHCPNGDIFKPRIEVTKGEKGSETIRAECPACKYGNWFVPRHPNDFMYMDSDWDENGYYLNTKVPAHYGRRCKGYEVVKGEPVQCEYRWAGKQCETCRHENDIAARYCGACKAEMVDPNERLVIEFAKFAKDPYQLHTDRVVGWKAIETLSKAGREMWRIEVETTLRQFVYFAVKGKRAEDKLMFATGCDPLNTPPKTITYKKNRESGFYDVFSYNSEEDKDPSAPPELPMQEAKLAPEFEALVFENLYDS